MPWYCCVFFCQAEDGIRDLTVTGVQTCALPISMEVAVLGQPGQWHRAWSLFLLDHGRRVPEVLAHVTKELETRRDIYGYDLLAWALHKSGRDGAARIAMARALALGTDDPLLLRHAAAIGR